MLTNLGSFSRNISNFSSGEHHFSWTNIFTIAYDVEMSKSA